MICLGAVLALDGINYSVLNWLKRYRYWALAPALLLALVLGWGHATELYAYLSDPGAVQELVLRLGWLGPSALVSLNALQIVIAPIPGYVVQVAAGYLFGPFWGGVWGSLGMLIGATIAFWLARVFGRPLAERLVGRSRLDKWEGVSHSTSAVVWFFLLLGPTGDIPYFLAGLSSVGYIKILTLTTLLRVPAVFLAAAAGATALPWWQLITIYSILAGIAVLYLLFQERLRKWMEARSKEPLPTDSLPPNSS